MEFVKEYPVEKLRVWDKNPRKNDEAAEKLKGIIMEYGFVNPIVIDQNGVIRAGHTRLKAALSLKRAHVPVLIYDFKDEAQAIGYAIADNKLSEIAEWDFEQLDELMNELEEMDFDTSLTGFDETDFTENTSNSKTEDKDLSGEINETFEVVVECEDEEHQQRVYEMLKEEGLECRVLTL